MSSEEKHERRKKTINRIHRLQGQLAGLERIIEADTPCEDIVIQARAIEKAMSSLIEHVVGGYLEHQARDLLAESPDVAVQQLKRIFGLLNS